MNRTLFDILGIPSLVVLLTLFLGHACAQNVSVQNGQAQPLQMQEHPQHAASHALGTEQTLLTGGEDWARGERPLSDFPTELKREIPLGDIARFYRTHRYVPTMEVK